MIFWGSSGPSGQKVTGWGTPPQWASAVMMRSKLMGVNRSRAGGRVVAAGSKLPDESPDSRSRWGRISLRQDEDMWDPERASRIAAEFLSGLGSRWDHVRSVGRLADDLLSSGRIVPAVAVAAWLHDLGYAPALVSSGLHSVDGAAYLRNVGAPSEVVSMVAWHTGAGFEAEERGLVDALARFPKPDPDHLAALTLLDLVVGPDGRYTSPRERVAEILSRYDDSSAVHRAVTRSRPHLLAAADAAREALGLPDEWPVGAAQGVV